MSCNEVFNWPPFTVRPDAPQVELCLRRFGGALDAPGWGYRDERGAVRFSAAVYFGTLILQPGEPSVREQRLRSDLDLPEDAPVRIDYACTADRTMLLRIGIPESTPLPYPALAQETIDGAEALINEFLARDFRTVILSRCCQRADDEVLFEGEGEIAEGFLGIDGLPLPTEPA